MSQALKFLQGVGGAEDKLYSDDVFSAYTYTGNGGTQTITNGIDLAGKGGMVWTKSRSQGSSGYSGNNWIQTDGTGGLYTNGTDAFTTISSLVSGFNSNGHTVGSHPSVNNTSDLFVSWTFRKAPKFFDVVTYTGNGVAGRQIPHSLGIAPGMIVVKCTSAISNWQVFHTGAPTGSLALNSTATLDTVSAQYYFGNDANIVAPTSSNFTVGGTYAGTQVNQNGATYVAYLFAHDTSADGIIQCGSFTTDGSENATVNLGWEPQFLIVKPSAVVGDWKTFDTMRGWNQSASDYYLNPNLSASESNGERGTPTATGFNYTNEGVSKTFIYLAIRRPNKPPTSGTQVYNAIARTGTGAAATVTGVGFAPDIILTGDRNQLAANTTKKSIFDRLRGNTAWLVLYGNAENTGRTDDLLSFNSDGASFGADALGRHNFLNDTYIYWFLRRTIGVVDQVCYLGTGTNKTETHGLQVAPELWIIKGRSGSTDAFIGSTSLAATEYLTFGSTAGKATGTTYWNNTYPTSSALSVGTALGVNTSAATYVAYLFATKAGISKVGSYTGNGSSQTINCGFTTGSRFVLIKRTDSTGDWYVWDSTRGIIAANDPHLSLNTTAAEVTTDDSVDPDASGFIVNQVAATNINVASASYIYLSLA